MKNFCITLLLATLLTSCNTTIGIGRDFRDGFLWTKRQIQEANARNAAGSHQEEYGAPVY